MFDIQILAIAAVSIMMGAFMQGCLGFGFGMLSVPPMMMILPAEIVIPVQIPLSLMLIIPLAWQVRHHFEYKLVIPLIIGAVIGMPIGIWILYHLNGNVLKLIVGLVLVALPIIMLMGWTRPLPNKLYTLIPVGMLSATMQGSMSISAPPIILFLTNQGMDKDLFRANVLLYFGGLGVISLTSFAMKGMYTGNILVMMAILFIMVPIGGFAGAKLSKHIPQQLFRTATLVVSGIMGIMLLLRSLKLIIGL